MLPDRPYDVTDEVSFGRMMLKKRYTGDLEATGQGEMLTTTTATEGSAGYVAMERVTGALHGKEGSFVLQHNGVMDGGDQRLAIVVVPASGTRALRGISGTMTIEIDEVGHGYVLEYGIGEGR